jgi:hypothetical protein
MRKALLERSWLAMGIEGVGSNPEYPATAGRAGKPSPKAADAQSARAHRPTPQQPGSGAPAELPDTNTQEAIQDQLEAAQEHASVLNHVLAMQDAAREKQAQRQLELQLDDVTHDLATTRQSLSEAQHQKLEETLAAASSRGPLTHWEQRTLAEKSQAINALKESVLNLQNTRTDLVESLAEQVRTNTYQITGAEILEGIGRELL